VARPVAQVDALLDQLPEAQPLGERGRKQEPGVGDQSVVIERRAEPVEAVG
jgi:hypothetical protein